MGGNYTGWNPYFMKGQKYWWFFFVVAKKCATIRIIFKNTFCVGLSLMSLLFCFCPLCHHFIWFFFQVSVTNSVLVSSNETPELASYPSPKLSQDQFPEAEVASKPPQPPPTFNPPTPPRPISCCSSSEAITSVDLHKNSLV